MYTSPLNNNVESQDCGTIRCRQRTGSKSLHNGKSISAKADDVEVTYQKLQRKALWTCSGRLGGLCSRINNPTWVASPISPSDLEMMASPSPPKKKLMMDHEVRSRGGNVFPHLNQARDLTYIGRSQGAYVACFRELRSRA